MYDIWRMQAINDLQMLNARRQALINIPDRIAELESKVAGIRSAAADGTPVKGGGSGREDMLLNNIVARAELSEALEEARRAVSRADAALGILNGDERKLLEYLYISSDTGGAYRLAEEFNIDYKTVYKRARPALSKFTVAMYGDK